MKKTPSSSSEIIRGDIEAARIYGVSTRTIKTWRDEGMPASKDGREYLYFREKTDPWVELKHRAAADNGDLSPIGKVKLARELARLRKEKVEAGRAERQEEAELGNVLRRDEWELFAIEVVQKARDRLMRLPKMLCKHVPRKCHKVLQTEGEADVRKILEEMARDLAEGATD
ncbi:MAG: hypothetical protein KGL39_26280 [Patescibacteria group bacterium]|nr:hypothetical protein [Patescibacteria group bacterium]